MAVERIAALALVQGNEVLLAQRSFQSDWAPGMWHVPGGKVEAGETVEAAALREITEEIGVEVQLVDVAFRGIVAYDQASGRHVDTFCFSTNRWTGNPSIKEPQKCEALDWFALDSMPDNMTEHSRVVYTHEQPVYVRVRDGKIMQVI